MVRQGHTELVGREYVQSAFSLWQKCFWLKPSSLELLTSQNPVVSLVHCSSHHRIVPIKIQKSHIFSSLAAYNVPFDFSPHVCVFLFPQLVHVFHLFH